MIRNIRHIQIEKIAFHPNLFKAILTFEEPNISYDESDDIEFIKVRELEKRREVSVARSEDSFLGLKSK